MSLVGRISGAKKKEKKRRWWVGSLEPATSRGDFDSGKTMWPVLSLEANGEMGEVFAARGQRGREACGKPQFLIKDVLREGREPERFCWCTRVTCPLIFCAPTRPLSVPQLCPWHVLDPSLHGNALPGLF